jgi:hypothetical protein
VEAASFGEDGVVTVAIVLTGPARRLGISEASVYRILATARAALITIGSSFSGAY